MADAGPKSGKSDTTPEALRVQYDLYRRMSSARKFELIFDTYEMGRQLAMAGLRIRHPDATEQELWRLWAQQHLGRDLYERCMERTAVNEKRETEEVIERFADVLDSLGIRYAIGGSIASALYGTVRFTRDADISIESFTPVADRLYELLKDEFYVSKQAMEQALKSHASFNIIHFETAFKIDVFIHAPGGFEMQLLDRSRRQRLSDMSRRDVSVVSPEDIVLLKLRWFRETDYTSERQWHDVLGVLTVQGKSLDFEYLADAAGKLGLTELLDRAIAEADT